MKTSMLATCTVFALALAGCLSDPSVTLDDQDEGDDATATTIAAFAPDILKFTGPAVVCAGVPGTGQISLLSDPQGPLTVSVTSGTPAMLTVGPPTSFGFDSSNWSASQPVKLNATPGGAPGNVTITATAPGATPKAIVVYVKRTRC